VTVTSPNGDLVDRIEKRIQEIPVTNRGYIACHQELLHHTLSRSLIRQIAWEAAEEAALAAPGHP
jgi:hypothetical protein